MLDARYWMLDSECPLCVLETSRSETIVRGEMVNAGILKGQNDFNASLGETTTVNSTKKR